MNLASLRTYINTYINTKYGADKITGAVHNTVLHEMIDSLIEIVGTGFGGDIAPGDNPGAQSNPIYFMASSTGTYTYCGGVVITTIPAFVLWDGSAWKAKNIGLPEGVGEASQCKGLVFAGDAQPSGKSLGDWYVFMGGGSLTWTGGAKISSGIVYLASQTQSSDTWGFIPFGGDPRFRGIIEPGFSPSGITHAHGDYYIARTSGDFSAFAGIAADAVTATGVMTFSRSTGQWVFGAFTGGSGSPTSSTEHTYTIDFYTTATMAQDINMLPAGTITAITARNVTSLWLTYAGGVRVEVNMSNPALSIPNGDVMTWEIGRTTEGSLAAIGIQYTNN